MHRYRVIDASATGQVVALSDSVGQRHIARALHHAPCVGSCLQGGAPGLGFRVLVCLSSGQLVRVIFELVNCPNQDEATKRYLLAS